MRWHGTPLRDFGFGAETWMGTGDMAARQDQGATCAIPWMALRNVTTEVPT